MTWLARFGRSALRAAWVGGVVLLTGIWNAAGAPARLSAPLVVTQVPCRGSQVSPENQRSTGARKERLEGARLVLVSSEGQVRVLSEGFHSACDPNVSFDGNHILFAAKRTATAPWRIWEMGVDGAGLRAVSPENLEARHPIYAATLFTLNSPEPWAATIFVGQEPTLNEWGQPSASSLYNVRLDGTELRRITFNPNANSDPFQMWDGRVIYSAARYLVVPGSQTARVGLYAIHVEGADMELYGGERAGRIQQMPCATEKGQIVFIESDEFDPEGAGQLASVEEKRPHVTYQRLSHDPAFLFRYPAPWDGNQILVSRRASERPDSWSIFCFDTQQGSCEPVFDTAEFEEIQAVPVKSRPRPDGHSTVVEMKYDAGIFYGLNCYDADPRLARHTPLGTVQQVRFIEGVSQQAVETTNRLTVASPFVARRLIGEAPVEADGSFNVEVPADVPILLQTLDREGLALATCGWIWVKPKEKRGCIGCHEDPERVPENQYVLALRRPSNRLVVPAEGRRAISFCGEIAPLLQRHCATADCHGGKETALQLPLNAAKPSADDLALAYAALLLPQGGPQKENIQTKGRYVDPGQARTSWLVWQLIGRDTSRPWDQNTKRPEHKTTQMPPSGKGEQLAPEELRTIIQWIDMGAPFSAP